MPSKMEEIIDFPIRELIPMLQNRFTGITHYMGILTQRMPFDHWVYQEIIHETDPDFIIEIGVYLGGHMLMLAHLCDARGKGHVIGIDPLADRVNKRATDHPRVTFIPKAGQHAVDEVTKMVGNGRVLVIEDSAHSYTNTLEILRAYSKLCKIGDYLICEDTICNHGLEITTAFNPYGAVDAFLSENSGFQRDYTRESFILTWNPGGFLRRMK